jgi:hypothetical protein
MTSYSQLVFVVVTLAALALPASAKSNASPGLLAQLVLPKANTVEDFEALLPFSSLSGKANL